MRTHPGVEAEVPCERACENPHRVTGLRPRALGQLNGAVPLTGPKLIDDTIAQLGRFAAGHDYCSHANTPTRVPPSPVLEGNEAIRRKQRSKSLNTASALGLSLTDIRDIDRELGELEKTPRRLLARRLSARNYPTHRLHHAESAAIAPTLARIAATNRLRRD
jgi:hypothetical protein